ncbi:MAG: aminotransferase class I/II-fold pyridoxal phosphate-dependent enzyme [Acidimicrobiia bacterium]|nr:aminotransferase class I/II-fold pyridoxal phosphate-dependent enzyme [Acidimicrobiia bacterium]
MTGISKRAGELLEAEMLDEYLIEQQTRRHDAYHPSDNPDGYISLCVAENKLVWDLLEDKLASSRDIDHHVIGYDEMFGSSRFRQRVARFLSRTFIGHAVDPDHLVMAAGAGTILETVFYAIADAGEGVLVPTPSYAGFWLDLEARDGLVIVPVHTESGSGFELTTGHLDTALERADRPIRALLFTTPNNPLGTVYSAAEIRVVLDWCEANRIHAVIDEIYALSVFGDGNFVSASTFPMGDFVHIVWAFSKDFAVSGLRCGVLYTQNEQIRAFAQTVAYWQAVSGDTQHVLGELIADTAWVDGFIAENQRRLRAAYRAATEALDEIQIDYIPSSAGFFLVADFRPFLEEPTWAAESHLWRRILEEANVNLTPGTSLRCGEPGFFRICFASQPSPVATEGIKRVGALLG